MRTRLTPLLVLLTLSACSQGPTGDALQADLQAKLDRDFKGGLFAVAEFDRNGHYAFSSAEGEPRLLIYYKAQLELQEDYTFSDWEHLNLDALTTVLGAQPQGVKGVEHDGNAKGDVVRVMGTLTYAPDGDDWTLSGVSPQGQAGARAAGMDEPSPFTRSLDELAKQHAARSNRNQPEHVAAIEAELARARLDIGLRLDALDGRPTLVTGVPTGEYHALGAGLAAVAEGDRLGHYASAGSLENCRLVLAGQADFGIVQSDLAHQALAGEGPFAGQPAPGLRAVCALYPELVQVVTRSSGGLISMEQLAGKTVNLGPIGSGSRANALRVLEAYGVDPAGLAHAGELELVDAARALGAGELDALFVTTAAPVRPLAELADAHALTFLPIAGAAAEGLRARQLEPLTLPANSYHGLEASVVTMGVTALVVTREETPAARVDALLDLLFDHPQQLAEHSARAALINARTARAGVSLPLHPAAAARLVED